MQYTICLAADENYIKYASVVISSIINNIEENSQDNFVFYLFNNGLSSQCTLQIKNLERRLNDRCQVKIQLCSADESLFKKFPGWGTSIKGQYMTYFRFFMADFIPANIEKCLYLDSDIVVTGDIRPLFKEDLKDCILGGVRDLCDHSSPRVLAGKQGNKDFVFKDKYAYINAGVILINFQLWIKENLKEKCIDFLNNHVVKFPDQDAINAVCEGRIKFLDPKWNMLWPYFFLKKNGDRWQSAKYEVQTDSDISKSLNDIKIIHFASIKPWGKMDFYKRTLMTDITKSPGLLHGFSYWYQTAEHLQEFPELHHSEWLFCLNTFNELSKRSEKNYQKNRQRIKILFILYIVLLAGLICSWFVS